jgi:AcrR family transcriptional regulator
MALDAAEAIAIVHGYRGISARKVASAIHYTVGTLYLVFENLDNLILHVNGRTLDDLFLWLKARQEDADAREPEAALIALASAYIAYAEAQSPRWNMLFEYVALRGEELPEWYAEKLGRVFDLVETAFKTLTRDSVEIQRSARVLWAGVHGICVLKIRERMNLVGGLDAQAMARILIENFIAGFRREHPQ